MREYFEECENPETCGESFGEKWGRLRNQLEDRIEDSIELVFLLELMDQIEHLEEECDLEVRSE